MVDRGETKSARKRRQNQNAVTFWLDTEDYERLKRLAESQGVSRKQIFIDLFHRRYRSGFPILLALSHVVAASLAIERDGAEDTQLAKLRQEIDRLALLALDEVRTTSETPG